MSKLNFWEWACTPRSYTTEIQKKLCSIYCS